MDINYELYKVFYHVAVTLSFSEASKQLFISQSAVSQSIKVLEKKAEPDAVHPQYQTGSADAGRGNSAKARGTGHESDPERGKPAFRGQYLKWWPASDWGQ